MKKHYLSFLNFKSSVESSEMINSEFLKSNFLAFDKAERNFCSNASNGVLLRVESISEKIILSFSTTYFPLKMFEPDIPETLPSEKNSMNTSPNSDTFEGTFTLACPSK